MPWRFAARQNVKSPVFASNAGKDISCKTSELPFRSSTTKVTFCSVSSCESNSEAVMFTAKPSMWNFLNPFEHRSDALQSAQFSETVIRARHSAGMGVGARLQPALQDIALKGPPSSFVLGQANRKYGSSLTGATRT